MSDQLNEREKREVSGFTSLAFNGMGKIDLIQGDHEELEIVAQAEIRSRIKTEVRDGTLYIDYEEDWKDWSGIRRLSGDKITFNLMMREITSIAIAGVGNLDTPRIETPALSLALSGPGLLTIGTLKTTTVSIALNGVGVVDVAGSTDELTLSISGAGSVRASRLEAGKADVKLSGVGNATLWAKDQLDTAVSGAGYIEYYGKPLVNQRNSGLGVLKFMGNR